MFCSKCNGELKCQDTYAPKNYLHKYRRLKCVNCGEIIYTQEKICPTSVGRKMFREKWNSYQIDKK